MTIDPSGENEPGGYAALVFMHCLGNPGKLERGRIAVFVGRGAEHDDDVEAAK
jgi:hypothetical protein